MKRFLQQRMDELTIGQSLVYSLVITAVCFAPFLLWSSVLWLKEKISDWRSSKE